MSAFGRFCWKSRRWKSVKFYTCFDASVLERREGPHSPRPTYSMTLTLALRHVCSIVGHFFPAQRNFRGGRKSDFFNRIGPKRTCAGALQMSAPDPKDGVLGRRCCGYAQKFG